MLPVWLLSLIYLECDEDNVEEVRQIFVHWRGLQNSPQFSSKAFTLNKSTKYISILLYRDLKITLKIFSYLNRTHKLDGNFILCTRHRKTYFCATVEAGLSRFSTSLERYFLIVYFILHNARESQWPIYVFCRVSQSSVY